MSSASSLPVTAASRSNGDPATEHRHRPTRPPAPRGRGRRPGGARPRRPSTAAARSSRSSLLRSPAPATSSSRKNGLPPVRLWSASTARYGGSCSNTAARNSFTSAGPRRPSCTWVTEVAPVEAGEEVGGGVAPREPVGAVGADEHQRAAVGLGEQLEGGRGSRRRPSGGPRTRRGAGPPPDSERTRSTPARTRSSAERLGSFTTAAQSGLPLTSVLPRASRNSSIGRPTVPGSAWPASTSVPGGALATSSCTSRVLPMPASPAIRAIVGHRRGAEERAQPPEVGLPADHDRRQPRASHEHRLDRTVQAASWSRADRAGGAGSAGAARRVTVGSMPVRAGWPGGRPRPGGAGGPRGGGSPGARRRAPSSSRSC